MSLEPHLRPAFQNAADIVLQGSSLASISDVTLLGLFGLILAGGAIDTGMYHVGLALFCFALLYVFWLIKRPFDTSEPR